MIVGLEQAGEGWCHLPKREILERGGNQCSVWGPGKFETFTRRLNRESNRWTLETAVQGELTARKKDWRNTILLIIFKTIGLMRAPAK